MAGMSPPIFQFLTLFGSLVFFVAQWTGVTFLRRSSAKLPWTLMVAGLFTSTSAVVFMQLAPMLGMSLFRSGRFYEWWWILPSFGNLTFALGFALHGLQMARASQRQGELEQLVSAMSEEMDRLREGITKIS